MRRYAWVFVGLLALAPATASAQLSVYSELFVEVGGDGTLTLTAFGVAGDESPEGCAGVVDIDVYLFGPGNNLLSSWANSDWCGASTTTTWYGTLDDLPQEGEGSFSARATARGPNGQYNGCAVAEQLLGHFVARFRYTGVSSPNGKRVFYKDACEGVCQPARWCSTNLNPVINVRGATVRLPFLPVSGCLFGDEYYGFGCVQQAGAFAVGAFNDGCGNIGNPQPQVSITSPTNGSWLASPASGTVVVSTWDAVGNVPRVDYYVNGNWLATTQSAPFSLPFGGVGPGTYVVNAVAYDDAGAGYTVSAPVTVNVY